MKVNLRLLLLILYCSIISFNLLGQSNRFISGKLLDSKTKEPIPFATLILEQHQLGVITNTEGDFHFNNNSDFQSDVLIISCIGYYKKSINFKNLSTEEGNTIYLSPATINGNPVRKEYLIVHRYRIYKNAPTDIIKKGERLIKRQKYSKALKLYDREIADNKYDSELFESRANVKKLLGDLEGANEDQERSTFLSKHIMYFKTIIGLKSNNDRRKVKKTG